MTTLAHTLVDSGTMLHRQLLHLGPVSWILGEVA